ncbi:MAG: serine hydrolase domain-containing protein [Anaerolineales bacterium]|jgi:CubicO group peptidase (beta-lactamase class C family)
MNIISIRFNWRQSLLVFILITLTPFALVGCDPSPANGRERLAETDRVGSESLPAADYAPLAGEDWEISTPEEQGLDPELVEDLYRDAEDLDTLYSVLLVKNGVLVGEGYFNGAARDEKRLVQSATKSMMSALVGVALEEGCLESIDQKMIEFFPEAADQVTDPRKREITIQQMLQMRSGYPDEETDPAFLEALYYGVYTPLIEDFPLVSPPGTAFHYSNLTYSWLAVILQRACGTDLRDFSQEHLFGPLGAEVGDWLEDREGNYVGSGGIHLTPREAAKFGQLFLDNGKYQDVQILPAAWVNESLKIYSQKAKDYGWGFPFGPLDYGYGWWHANIRRHDVWFAWGHGGQLIVLLDDLDLVIVTTADPFFGQHDGNSWKHEKAAFELVGDFIRSLPEE